MIGLVKNAKKYLSMAMVDIKRHKINICYKSVLTSYIYIYIYIYIHIIHIYIYNELAFLKDKVLKNGYPISFIDKCFKTFLDQLYFESPQLLTDGKKTLTLVLPFLGELSLQTKTKLQKVLKRTLDCCKIQKVFKNQGNLSNVFLFKNCLPYNLASCTVYKFQCGTCSASYYGDTDRHL